MTVLAVVCIGYRLYFVSYVDELCYTPIPNIQKKIIKQKHYFEIELQVSFFQKARLFKLWDPGLHKEIAQQACWHVCDESFILGWPDTQHIRWPTMAHVIVLSCLWRATIIVIWASRALIVTWIGVCPYHWDGSILEGSALDQSTPSFEVLDHVAFLRALLPTICRCHVNYINTIAIWMQNEPRVDLEIKVFTRKDMS